MADERPLPEQEGSPSRRVPFWTLLAGPPTILHPYAWRELLSLPADVELGVCTTDDGGVW